MKIVKYLIKYCLNFALLMLVFFSSILYLFGVDDFKFSYRQICIILVAFMNIQNHRHQINIKLN